MALKSTIATKIFGLAVLLLCLTIALSAFLLWQVTRLNVQLKAIVGRYQPLTSSAANLDEYGLRRRLAFERWFGTLNSAKPNENIIKEATTNYALFSDKITAEIAHAHELASAPAEFDKDRETLAEVRSTIDQIEANYAIITARQRQVLDLQVAGQHDRANDLLDLLNETQRRVQDQRARIQHLTQTFVSETMHDATERQKAVAWISVAATATSVLLGLTLSALITRRLVGPVRSLITGIKTVEQGDLTVQLPIQSSDEVGKLTQSFNFFIRELRAKDDIKRTFGKYIDPRVLDRVILQPGADETGKRCEMTIAFSDLVGFTDLSEQLTPAGMVNVLNRHFALQSDTIQKNGGVIDKFMGDAIMAFWGPPFTGEAEHAVLACRAALAQLKALDAFQTELPDLTGLRKNLPKIDLRIGLSTGEVIVGNIGSENTRSYTVMGDTVNLASRLENVNRIYGTQILASEATACAAGKDFLFREVDALVVKGKTESSKVFELLGLAVDEVEATQQLSERFAVALSAYRRQDWNLAEKELQSCLEIQAGDGPSKVLMERIAHFREWPPGSNWDGAFQLDSK
jgi:adenylate cyclase